MRNCKQLIMNMAKWQLHCKNERNLCEVGVLYDYFVFCLVKSLYTWYCGGLASKRTPLASTFSPRCHTTGYMVTWVLLYPQAQDENNFATLTPALLYIYYCTEAKHLLL